MKCPQWQEPTTWEENPWRPFCSERCQLIDLGQWAVERYRVPGENLTIKPSEPESE